MRSANEVSQDLITHLPADQIELIPETPTWQAAQALMDSILEPLLLVDDSHTIIMVNKAILERPGPKKELVGKYCPKAIHGIDGPFVGCPLDKALMLESAIEEEYFDSISNRWLLLSILPTGLITTEGRKIFLHKVLDVSARKLAEQELSLKAQLLDDATDSIFAHDFEGHFIYVNQSAYESRGYSKGEMLKMNLRDLDAPEFAELIKPRIEELLTKGGTVFESEHICRDSSRLPVEVHAKVIESGGHKIITSVVRDITEHKQAATALQSSLVRTREALVGIIQTMASTVEIKDPYTAGHQRRVAHIAKAIAEKIGLPPEQAEGTYFASLIHDLGKILVPSEILSKPSKLKPDEFSLIKNHSQIAYDILKPIEFSWPIAEIILQHHERIDGSGYPNGLTGETITIEAKIIAVADVVEAMSSHRPYRPALGLDEALEEILKNRGILYEPIVVNTCVHLFREEGLQIEDREADWVSLT